MPPQRLFRIIVGPVVTEQDFWSAKRLGKPLFDRTYEREWKEGISVFDSLGYAMRRARRARMALGRYIVEINLDGSILEVAQTGHDIHHYTIYGPPDDLLRQVVGTAIPVLEAL